MNTPFKHYIFAATITLIGVLFLFLIFPVTVSLDKAKNENSQQESEKYLQEEEVVVIEAPATSTTVTTTKDNKGPEVEVEKEEKIVPVQKPLFKYIEVTDSCGPYYQGDCLNIRSGPGTEFDIVKQIRNGSILKVGGVVEREDRTWYKIVFDEWIRYPERIKGDWYLAAEHVRVLFDEGDKNLNGEKATSSKRIVVDRSDQTLKAYDGDTLFMEETISTGLELTPTPRGEFTVFKKTPSRYMQGPLPGISSDYYDLPGVPWNLYFTKDGAVIHGAYWHDNFGKKWSHGCVNVPLSKAEKLYRWADLGTKVFVQG